MPYAALTCRIVSTVVRALLRVPLMWCWMQERLGSLTNKCMDGGTNDLEYFVQEGAHILGLQEHAHDAKVLPMCQYSALLVGYSRIVSVL